MEVERRPPCIAGVSSRSEASCWHDPDLAAEFARCGLEGLVLGGSAAHLNGLSSSGSAVLLTPGDAVSNELDVSIGDSHSLKRESRRWPGERPLRSVSCSLGAHSSTRLREACTSSAVRAVVGNCLCSEPAEAARALSCVSADLLRSLLRTSVGVAARGLMPEPPLAAALGPASGSTSTLCRRLER